MRKRKPLVAIIGRPNVGKSTLFNRITGTRRAIVEKIPGVTRDRNYASASYLDREFILVDTGGFESYSKHPLLEQIRRQSRIAIREADIIIFLMDGKEGLSSQDMEIADMLRKADKKVYYVINKMDNKKAEMNLPDFYTLGVEKLYPISAEHGRNVDELMDDIYPFLDERGPHEDYIEYPRIAVVGRPNVGKSTLINKLAGKDRVLISPEPGTTRDAIDTVVTHYKKKYIFIDTAGIRRRTRIDKEVESYSVMRALKSIERCDIAILLVDASEGLTSQDLKIFRYIEEAGKGCIICMNKWDIVEKNEKTLDRYRKGIVTFYPHLSHIPILFISALTGKRVTKIFNEIEKVKESFSKRISTGEINRFIRKIQNTLPSSSYRGRPLKIYYATQTASRPPEFVIFINYPEAVDERIKRYAVNSIREEWKFTGVPIRIFFRKKAKN